MPDLPAPPTSRTLRTPLLLPRLSLPLRCDYYPQDGCRVWNVDPTQQQDYVDVPWYRVADLAISTIRGTQRLIGAWCRAGA
mgnify:CR=1 FL=1